MLRRGMSVQSRLSSLLRVTLRHKAWDIYVYEEMSIMYRMTGS